MTIRPMISADIPRLIEMAQESGYPYPDLADPQIEGVMVATDEDGKVLAAVGAKRIVELYLWCGSQFKPYAMLALLREFHKALGDMLKAKGYTAVEAFLPPSIAARFGRRLERSFNWTRNWQSWGKRI